MPKLNLTGLLKPHTNREGEEIPGLTVRMDGFHLGQAQLRYDGKLSFGSIMQLENVSAGITDFNLKVGSGVDFNGEVFIAAGKAELFPGKKFSMRFEDGTDENEDGARGSDIY